ncbi:MAG: hypothetical protein PVF27_06940 [Gemmatimonadales bacterium]
MQGALDRYRGAERQYVIAGGSGTLVLYTDDDAVRKLTVRFDGDGAGGVDEYFYWNDSLFFVFSRWETFPIWPDQDPDDFGPTEHRYYFQDGRLIRWLVRSHEEDMRRREVPPDDARFAEEQRRILEQAAQWLGFARSDYADFDRYLESRH